MPTVAGEPCSPTTSTADASWGAWSSGAFRVGQPFCQQIEGSLAGLYGCWLYSMQPFILHSVDFFSIVVCLTAPAPTGASSLMPQDTIGVPAVLKQEVGGKG
jgi:hypothetical protein